MKLHALARGYAQDNIRYVRYYYAPDSHPGFLTAKTLARPEIFFRNGNDLPMIPTGLPLYYYSVLLLVVLYSFDRGHGNSVSKYIISFISSTDTYY